MTKCIVPAMNAFEGAAVDDIEIYGVHTLQELIGFLDGRLVIEPAYIDRDTCLNDQKGRYHSWISVTFAGSTR